VINLRCLLTFAVHLGYNDTDSDKNSFITSCGITNIHLRGAVNEKKLSQPSVTERQKAIKIEN